jgi:hypothetical protein
MLPSQSPKSHEEYPSIYKPYGGLLQFHLETIDCRWIQPLQTIPRFSSNKMYTTMDAACYQMREASVLVEIWKTNLEYVSLSNSIPHNNVITSICLLVGP